MMATKSREWKAALRNVKYALLILQNVLTLKLNERVYTKAQPSVANQVAQSKEIKAPPHPDRECVHMCVCMCVH